MGQSNTNLKAKFSEYDYSSLVFFKWLKIIMKHTNDSEVCYYILLYWGECVGKRLYASRRRIDMKYLFTQFDKVSELFWQHLYLVSVSLFIALCIAVPLAILVSRFSKVYPLVISGLGIMYTIPSLALFALMIPFLGLGTKSAITALVAYSQMTLVRNIVTAIRGIEPSIIEAAKGMGMNQWRIIRKIILPLAMPVVIAGIRIATVSMIGIAAIAAYINAGGLGQLIFEGIYQDHSGKIVSGTIAVAFLAIMSDLIFRLIERRLRTASS